MTVLELRVISPKIPSSIFLIFSLKLAWYVFTCLSLSIAFTTVRAVTLRSTNANQRLSLERWTDFLNARTSRDSTIELGNGWDASYVKTSRSVLRFFDPVPLEPCSYSLFKDDPRVASASGASRSTMVKVKFRDFPNGWGNRTTIEFKTRKIEKY